MEGQSRAQVTWLFMMEPADSSGGKEHHSPEGTQCRQVTQNLPQRCCFSSVGRGYAERHLAQARKRVLEVGAGSVLGGGRKAYGAGQVLAPECTRVPQEGAMGMSECSRI